MIHNSHSALILHTKYARMGYNAQAYIKLKTSLVHRQSEYS